MPEQMSTEKFIRAERKNRLEIHKLGVTTRHFEKETVRLNYDIDREKRSITKAFKGVIKTSGASDLGIPPRNEKDTSYEKCPSYMQGLKLSNKRLIEWRECERQLLKFIENHEVEREKQKRKKVFPRQNSEYDPIVIPLKKNEDLEDDVFLDNDTESVTVSDKTSPTDILKHNPEDANEKFDIKKWEAGVIESYKSTVCKHGSSSRPVSATTTLRSKSSPAFSNGNREFDSGEKKRTRPHTAQPRLRPSSSRSAAPTRPSSATMGNGNEPRFLITKDSTYIKTGKSFEKLLDNRPVDKPAMINNYLDTLKPPAQSGVTEKEPSIASMSTLCPVQEGNEDDEADDTFNDNAADDITSLKDESDSGYRSYGARKVSESTAALKRKFQKQLLSKLQRARSANSGSANNIPHNPRSHFKHSNSDLSSYADSSRRSRRNSESSSIISMPMSRTGSIVSSHRPSISLGIPADIDEISREQDKVASEITADKPLSSCKLVSISKVVRAAMTFSRVARKRCLVKMQEENSSDAHEIVRQERLRKLQSRQNVLNSIASQWDVESNQEINIEQVE